MRGGCKNFTSPAREKRIDTKYVKFINMVCIISKLILVHNIHFSKVCTVIFLDEYNI